MKQRAQSALQTWRGCALVILIFLGCQFTATTQSGAPAIRLNQVGFYPNSTKIAVVTGQNNGGKFYIINGNRDTVFNGMLTAEKKSSWSSRYTRIADFSNVSVSGYYTITVPGIGESVPFRIGEGIYDTVSRAVLKGFYFQRSDLELVPEYAGSWSRPAGHPDTEVLIHPSASSSTRPAGTKLASPGGWYDAGDYNKYIVNSGITMGTLLSAYEDFPEYYRKLNINIPESNNAVPDILDEVLYNLRWMLTMQDPADGGVYHKCTNAVFDGMVMPGITKEPRYMVQKSTAATLDFAAVTAQSARVFRAYGAELPGLADSCLAASVKAWGWAIINPAVVYNQELLNRNFKPAVLTGDYGDGNPRDEWFWAAAELLVSTGDDKYYPIVSQFINDPASVPSWANVEMLGFYTLLRVTGKQQSHEDLIVLKNSLISMADIFLLKKNGNAFQTVMGQSAGDFIWGSNSVAANQGIFLVNAYLLTRDHKYLDGALSNLDYILGRNATGYSFITGIGTKRPMFPHHRPSEADGIKEPVPGLLVGGPNPGMQDKCTYAETEPETAYTDLTCSYASNEIAINWNAPVVYLVNAIQALSPDLKR
ncbi:MAG: glycoside hydrolase family 9 protein [Chitinophagaceae bacterium]